MLSFSADLTLDTLPASFAPTGFVASVMQYPITPLAGGTFALALSPAPGTAMAFQWGSP